jgi:hypothetical protein
VQAVARVKVATVKASASFWMKLVPVVLIRGGMTLIVADRGL